MEGTHTHTLSLEQTASALHPLPLVLLKVVVDGGHRQEDSRTAPDRPHEVGKSGQETNAQTTKGGRGRNVPVQLPPQRRLPVPLDEVLLLLELLGDVPGARSRDLNPRLAEQGARREHEGHVEQSVQRVLKHIAQVRWRGDVVGKAANRLLVTGHVVVLPLAEQADDEVAAEPLRKDLSEEINIAHKRGLQDDRNVRGVEELDRERLLDAALLLRLQVDDNLEVL